MEINPCFLRGYCDMSKDIFEVSGSEKVTLLKEEDSLFELKEMLGYILGMHDKSLDTPAQFLVDLKRATSIVLNNKIIYDKKDSDTHLAKLKKQIELAKEPLLEQKIALEKLQKEIEEKEKTEENQKDLSEIEKKLTKINEDLVELDEKLSVKSEELQKVSLKKREDAIKLYTKPKDNLNENENKDRERKLYSCLQQGVSTAATLLTRKNYTLSGKKLQQYFYAGLNIQEIRIDDEFTYKVRQEAYAMEDANGNQWVINPRGTVEQRGIGNEMTAADLKQQGYKPIFTETTTATINLNDYPTKTPTATVRVEVESNCAEFKYTGPSKRTEKTIIQQAIPTTESFLKKTQGITQEITQRVLTFSKRNLESTKPATEPDDQPPSKTRNKKLNSRD